MINIGREHLERHLPVMFHELCASNELDQLLQTAAKRTRGAMNSRVEAGYSEDEAWQMSRERLLILRPDVEDISSTSATSKRSRSIFQTLNEIAEFRQRTDPIRAKGLAQLLRISVGTAQVKWPSP